MSQEIPQQRKLKIRIAGVGSAGVEMLKEINASGRSDATLVAIDTDLSTLTQSGIKHILPCGGDITNNLGCGGDPNVAKEAAVANLQSLKAVVNNADFIVILSALGGGTGSVIAPILSKLAFESGIKFIVNFCILPLEMEGSERVSLAQKAFKYLHKRSNIAVSLPNDIIMSSRNKTLKEAFGEANKCVANAVCSMLDMISGNGIINTDFPTLKKIFPEHGENSFFAYGCGFGENAAEDAVIDLKKCPLLSGNSPAAKNLLINIVCGESMEMNKTRLLLESVKDCFKASAKTGFGIKVNPDYDSKIEITAIGTLQNPGEILSVCKKISEIPACPKNPEHIVSNEKNTDNSAESAVDSPQSGIKSPQRRLSTRIPEESPSESQEPTASEPPETMQAPQPAPRPVTEDEEPPKKRRGFFVFGKKKGDLKQEQPVATQSEFKFVEKSQQRGFFEDTPPNMRNGEDLDVPTFMRRNIKINVS